MLTDMSQDGCQPLQTIMYSSPNVEADVVAEVVQAHEATRSCRGKTAAQYERRGYGRQGRPEPAQGA